MTDLPTPVDRGLYAMFSRHADRARHDRDRDRYRGAALDVGFDTYLARVYGASWLVAAGIGTFAALAMFALPAPALQGGWRTVLAAVPALPPRVAPGLPKSYAAAAAALLAGTVGKVLTVKTGSAYLKWRAEARRSAIERTAPGRVRSMALRRASARHFR